MTAIKSKPAYQGNSKARLWVMLAVLVCLVAVFLLRGGVTGFASQMASSCLLRRQPEPAKRWLNLARSTFGDQAQVEFLLARTARLEGDFELMVEHLVKANELGYEADQLNREQTLANLSIGEMDASSEALARDWIAEIPEDVGLVVDAFANGLANQSRFEEASKLLEDYEKAFPDDAMVNYRFGVMNEHIRGYKRAEQEYQQALTKDPNYVQAAWRLARLKSTQNLPKESIEILKPFQTGKQALAVKTFMAHCHQQAGELEIGRSLFKEVADLGHAAALESYRAVDERPERFLAASDLGVLDIKLGNWEEAKYYLELALEVNPKDFIARNAYGQTLRRLGLHEQAEKELARITAERQEYNKITVLRDQVAQNKNDTASRVEMGRILFKYESERFGLFWIRSALAIDPNCQGAHQFMAEYYANKAGQSKNAKEKSLYEQKSTFHRSYLDPSISAVSK